MHRAPFAFSPFFTFFAFTRAFPSPSAFSFPGDRSAMRTPPRARNGLIIPFALITAGTLLLTRCGSGTDGTATARLLPPGASVLADGKTLAGQASALKRFPRPGSPLRKGKLPSGPA